MADKNGDFITAVFALSVDPERFKDATVAEMAAAWPELNRKIHETRQRLDHGK